MQVFSTEPGSCVKVELPESNGTVGIVTVPGLGSTKVCVTRVTVSEQANYQFLHTLGNFIYVYVFGDRIGQLGISGLAFHQPCGNGPDGAIAARGSSIGLEEVMQFYRENKISKRPTPLKITVGLRTTFTVFLIGAHYDVVDPQSKICQFDFTFALVPEA